MENNLEDFKRDLAVACHGITAQEAWAKGICIKGETLPAKVKKVVTLANATFDELCELPRDNFNDGDFSIMTDSKVVWLSEQHRGESNKQHIEIPRAAFNRLIRKYSSEQKPS